MTFTDIPAGLAIFLDANTLIYHFTRDPKYGAACTDLLKRLRKHHSEIPTLKVYAEAIARIPVLGIQVIPITHTIVGAATLVCHQHELLTGDALIVATMQANGVGSIASNDSDFDRVPRISRYAPT